MPRSSKVTEAALRAAVADSLALAQVIVKLGLVPAGGNYKTVQEKLKVYGINTSHFTGSGWNTGARYQAFGKSTLLEDILVENSTYYFTHGLRKRLLKEGVKDYQCEECGLGEWRGLPISLELHHRNGINNDHRLINLQLLCPNCHAQTNSYRGKNQLKASARVV